MDDQYKQFPAALTAAREAAGLTQKELADRVGKTQQAVAKWENGESNPTRRSMGKLIAVLPELEKLGLPTLREQKDRVGEIYGNDLVSEPDTKPYGPLPRAFYSMLLRSLEDQLPEDLQQYLSKSRADFDYQSPNAVIEISAPVGTLHPFALTQRLWRLSTARIKNNDKRGYYLLLLNSETKNDYRQQMVVARYISEANMHGITLLVVNDAKQAVEMIKAIESGVVQEELTTFENFYEDGDPHE